MALLQLPEHLRGITLHDWLKMVAICAACKSLAATIPFLRSPERVASKTHTPGFASILQDLARIKKFTLKPELTLKLKVGFPKAPLGLARILQRSKKLTLKLELEVTWRL